MCGRRVGVTAGRLGEIVAALSYSLLPWFDVLLDGAAAISPEVGDREGPGSFIQASTSAEPDLLVLARLPCLAISSRDEQMMLLAVLMLKVLWKSPPVPTMSH